MAEHVPVARGPIPPHILWPGIVVTLISISIGFAAVTAYLAVSDPSATVVPDYYQKALGWDESAGRRAASDALGWSAEASVEAGADGAGNRALRLRITDARGGALEGLSARVTAFAHVRAGDVQRVELVELGDGFYAGPLRVLHPGLWQFQIEASGPGGRLVRDVQQWVAGEDR